MRALVTGAAGFIGSNLAIELERRGNKVVGLDDFSSGNVENLKDFNGDLVSADLADPSSWESRVGRVDIIFHQAACTDTTVTDQARMMRANVEAFRGLLSWAARTGAARVVYASSAGVYGDGPVPMRETAEPKPLNVYAFSKRVMESVAAQSAASNPQLKLVGLRYFNVYGPREQFKGKASSMIWQIAQQMLAGKRPRIFEFGEQYRDFIYVKDVIAANLAAADKGSAAYNVCTGSKTSFNRIIEALNAVLGLRLKPEYFKNPYSFYQNETLGDPSKAERELGFKAHYSVEEGIRDYFRGLKVPVGA